MIFILVFLTAFTMAGIAYGTSLILPNKVMYETVMNAIVLPVFFLSTALFPPVRHIGKYQFYLGLAWTPKGNKPVETYALIESALQRSG